MSYQSNPIFEYFTDSDKITCKASGAVTGKTLVKLAAGGADQCPVVATAAAGDLAYGVAGWDVKDGEKLTVYRRGVLSITAGAALKAGDQVEVGASGKAVKVATGKPVGQVHADATNGADAAVAVNF